MPFGASASVALTDSCGVPLEKTVPPATDVATHTQTLMEIARQHWLCCCVAILILPGSKSECERLCESVFESACVCMHTIEITAGLLGCQMVWLMLIWGSGQSCRTAVCLGTAQRDGPAALLTFSIIKLSHHLAVCSSDKRFILSLAHVPCLTRYKRA